MIPYFIVGSYGFLDLAKVCVMSGGTEIGVLIHVLINQMVACQ